MAKNHSPAFLRIVQDAKSRFREWFMADVKARLDAGDRFTLVAKTGAMIATSSRPASPHFSNRLDSAQ